MISKACWKFRAIHLPYDYGLMDNFFVQVIYGTLFSAISLKFQTEFQNSEKIFGFILGNSIIQFFLAR